MVYAGLPASTWASVLFPEPFGPMMACTSPARTVRSTPRRISRPSTEAWRFFISSMACLRPRSPRGLRPGLVHRLPNTAFQTDAEQPLRLHGELHGQLLEDFPAEAVHDHADGVLGRQAALLAVEDLVLTDL